MRLLAGERRASNLRRLLHHPQRVPTRGLETVQLGHGLRYQLRDPFGDRDPLIRSEMADATKRFLVES
jgi:hypothetical protein